MPNPELTDITIVLDRSGSMTAIHQEAIAGFNQFIKEQQATDGEARLTLVQFDDEYEVICSAIPIREMVPLTEQTYQPRGMTALLDAMGVTIHEMGDRFTATPEAERPGQVLLVVLTDGAENASRRYTRRQVFEMVRHQQEVYKWQFVFLAANQDAIAAGGDLGIAAGSSMKFAANRRGISGTFSSLSSSVSRFRTSRTSQSTDFFNKKERDQVADQEDRKST